MKDEEMAEEYAIKSYGNDAFTQAHLPQMIEPVRMYLKQSFLAGLKAGRPQWHEADVPTSPINKVVLGYIKHYNSKLFCLVGWNGKWWYDASTYNDEVKLIAWCEIPTFDKE